MEWEYERHRRLEIFDYSINYVANEEIRRFNDFADGVREEGRKNENPGRATEKKQEKQKSQRKSGNESKNSHKPVIQEARAATSSLPRDREDSDFIRSQKSNTRTAETTTAEMKRHGPSKNIRKSYDDRDEQDKNKRKEAGGTMTAAEFLGRIIELHSSQDSTKKAYRVADSFDISHEVDLLREIKDIRDELNILDNLFRQQRLVLEPFERITEARKRAGVHASNSQDISTPKSGLVDATWRHTSHIELMDENAKRVYRHLEDLLNLKQKQANVFEARTARVSGKTITVFTIVTIFLPASFMAAFFALSILEFPGVDEDKEDKMELGYTVKYTVIVTALVATPFIILALYVNPILGLLKIMLDSFGIAAQFLAKPIRIGRMISKAVLVVLKIATRDLSKLAKLLLRLVVLIFLKCPQTCVWIYNWIKGFGWPRRVQEPMEKSGRTGTMLRNTF